jgi:hypothetical protein
MEFLYRLRRRKRQARLQSLSGAELRTGICKSSLSRQQFGVYKVRLGAVWMGAQDLRHHRVSLGQVAGLSFPVDLVDSRFLAEGCSGQEGTHHQDRDAKKLLEHGGSFHASGDPDTR